MPPTSFLRLLLLVLAWSCRAWAQQDDASAADLFARGEAAFAAERFEEAAQLFERADAQAPHASVVYNAAVSWDQAGQLPRAADAYMTALKRGGLDERDALDSESRLGALSSQLGFVQIGKPVGGLISVGHKQREPIPVRFFLTPGEYTVLLETETSAAAETPITVVAGETLRVQLTLPVTTAPEVNSELEAAPPAPPPPVDAKPGPDGSTQRVLGWVSIAVGVAASGAAIYMGTQVLSEKQRYEDESLSRAQRNRALSNAEGFKTGTNIAWGSAGLFAGAGVILIVSAPPLSF